LISLIKSIKNTTRGGNYYMDMVDILTVPTPIFITNPRPNFVIPPNSKMMLLVDNQQEIKNSEPGSIKKNTLKNEFYEKELNLKKEKQHKKEEFDKIIENLRKKFHEQIDKNDE